MKKIKKPASLRTLKFRAWTLKVLSQTVPVHLFRRWYLKAYYAVWEVESTDKTPNPDDVYESGIAWSRKPLPTAEADRLLALHDAAVEADREADFSRVLRDNLEHH